MSDVFVSPARLADALADETVAVVDVRRPDAYREGHVPSAANVPFDEFRSPTDETPGKLPTAETFAGLLADAGISPDDRIVAYDDEFGVYASRFLVTAEVFGHDLERMHVLDGGYSAWRDGASRTESTATPTVEPADYACGRGDGPLVTAADLEAALESDAVIVDTRDRLEYETVHLPGAVNFRWRDLVDEERGRLESTDRCREILAEHGIERDRPVRLYCNTARRLSFVYAVLRELDHDDVAFYEGGIDAWAQYGGPVETTT